MSLLSVILFIARGHHIRRAYSLKYHGDADFLELLSRILVGQVKCPDKLRSALEQGIRLPWMDVYDTINPFGDRRGILFDSVWTFDLENDTVILTKTDGDCSAPLRLARERLLSLDDFELVSATNEPLPEGQPLAGPYWEPEMDPMPRERAFIGQMLLDFSYTWRHVIRRQVNTTTFMKLAYAIVWISRMEFTLKERTGFEHVGASNDRGPYVLLWDLPRWDTPEATLVQAGASWFVLSQDIQEGLAMVKNHQKSRSLITHNTPSKVIYAILTLRHVVLCRTSEDGLVWTKPEKLFDGDPASDIAIDMILWAAKTEPERTTINHLPIEIQDKILYHASSSDVASAKLGCVLGVGSPFSWICKEGKIGIQTNRRHRGEFSPIESLIMVNGVRSGLSYKPGTCYRETRPSQPPRFMLGQRAG